jgi:3',5'-cyclic AMP phosphodiesterase CpdA
MADVEPRPHLSSSASPASATATAARFILLGDIHVYQLAVAPWHLLGKRLLGQANLWLRRRARLRMDLLANVVERIVSLDPDMVLCSGDLTTTALHGEFEVARRMLDPIIEQGHCFVVPGNHDRYTFTAARTRRFERHFGPQTARSWPFYQQLTDRLHLVAFDPTRPTLLSASGRLDTLQLHAFTEGIVPQLPPDARLIVLCHYPLGTPPGQHPESHSHGLQNAADMVTALSLPNEMLYVHGHVHRPWCWRLPDAPNITAVNTGAPVLTGDDYPGGQGFWEVIVDEQADVPWQLTHHVMDATGQWYTSAVPAPQQPGEAVPMR